MVVISRVETPVTRRGVLTAATAAVTAGCVGGNAGQRRGVASVRVSNPTDRVRETELSVSGADGMRLDSRLAVPPRATVRLNNRVPMEQTVTLTVTQGGTTATREWTVQGSIRVLLATPVRFQTESEVEAPRENRADGRVDVSIQTANNPRRGVVTVTRGGTAVFEEGRRVRAGRRVIYHDRLDARGTATVSVDSDVEATKRLSLDDAVQLIAHLGEKGGIKLNRAGGG